MDFVYGDDLPFQQVSTDSDHSAQDSGTEAKTTTQEIKEKRKGRLEREPRVEADSRKCLRRGIRILIDHGESCSDDDDDLVAGNLGVSGLTTEDCRSCLSR